MRFDNNFNSKSSREFYKGKFLKKRISKFNLIAGNNDKSTHIYENILKRKVDYFNLTYKE